MLATLPMAIAACSTSVGPFRQSIEKLPRRPVALNGMRVIEITDGLARHVSVEQIQGNFAANFGDAVPVGTRVGVGDALEVTIWEAAPAALFGTATLGSRIGADIQTSQPNTLPTLEVGPSGAISIPFAGQVPAAGRTLRQIEQDIVARLSGEGTSRRYRSHRPERDPRTSPPRGREVRPAHP